MLAAAPVVTAGLEWWWLDERFVRSQLVGILMVIAGATTLSQQRATGDL
ncbi:MAG TPA: hypothetical protein VFY27_05960 [Woeseiaceae bacterium]|nr:hypothetical protein [Woeseiaceae bacterium]